jgi:hypothetical protein
MRVGGYTPDVYELERQHEIERRPEIGRQQEPKWMHRPRRARFAGRNRPGPERRYFSRSMFRPITSTSNVFAAEEKAA